MLRDVGITVGTRGAVAENVLGEKLTADFNAHAVGERREFDGGGRFRGAEMEGKTGQSQAKGGAGVHHVKKRMRPRRRRNRGEALMVNLGNAVSDLLNRGHDNVRTFSPAGF